MKHQEVVLITGASSGIGRSTAIYLASKGLKVYAAARRMDKLNELKPYGIIPVQLDVTIHESCQACVDYVFKQEGRIDVLFNNAGYGLYGAIEDITLEDARHQYDVNVFGLADMTKCVLPIMRAQKSGRIINTSSIGGKVHSLLGGWYHSTKFAVEGLTDCLRIEVKQFGIKVVLIEPGLISTEFPQITYDKAMEIPESSPYHNLMVQVQTMVEKDMKKSSFGSDPIVVAKKVYKAIISKHPKTRYSMGKLSKVALWGRKILPDKVLDYILLHR
jgi:NADP-dependent 3-hydroxy acid dehydrogenase YdfG